MRRLRPFWPKRRYALRYTAGGGAFFQERIAIAADERTPEWKRGRAARSEPLICSHLSEVQCLALLSTPGALICTLAFTMRTALKSHHTVATTPIAWPSEFAEEAAS